MRINKVEFDEKFSGIDMHAESEFKQIMIRNVPYYSVLRHITTCSVDKIHKNFILLYLFLYEIKFV